MRARLLKVLELRTDSPEFLEALDALALIQREAPDTLKKDSRRHLRADLERRSQDLAEAFLKQAEQIEARLQAAQDSVSVVLGDCERVSHDLDASERATSLFVRESAALRLQRREVEERAEAVNLFLKRFQLTEQHLAALGGEADTSEFYDALEQVRRIRDECGELLKGSHQGAGLEIFDAMVAHQEAAHAKAYAWVLRACASGAIARDLDAETSRMLLARAFAELKQGSPAFFSHCGELLAASRRQVLADKFLALVSPAPAARGVQHIDLHDPLRYVSDVLAAVHQSVAEEKDIFASVALAQRDELVLLLETAVGGMAAPLGQRMGAVVKGMTDPVGLFRAEQVLDFYIEVLAEFFRGGQPTGQGDGEEGSIVRAVRQLKDSARALFFRVVERRASELQTTVRSRAMPGADLSASMEVLDLVRTMRDVLAIVRDHSPASNDKSPERLAQLDSALRAFVEPVRALCHTADQVFPSQWDACVFAVNNLQAVQAVLALHDFTSTLVNELALEVGERLDALASTRADAALSRCGLQALLALLAKAQGVPPVASAEPAPQQPQQPLHLVSGLEAPRVRAALEVFYRDLSSSLVMPELDRIDAPRLRHQVRSATSAIVLANYNKLHDAVAAGGYPDGLLLYSKQQVQDLLGV